MQKLKYAAVLLLIFSLTACVSTQYPTGKRGKRKKKKCDCPDFGGLENKVGNTSSDLLVFVEQDLSNLNEVG